MSNKKVGEKLKDFVDLLEEEFGNIEGFSVKLEHPVKNGEEQKYADIKEFVIYYLHKEKIDIE